MKGKKIIKFLLESAATHHLQMTRVYSQPTWTSPSTYADILIGDNGSLEVLGIGETDFTNLDVTRNVEITLKNVLCAFNMRTNLISVSNTDNSGKWICWRNKKVILYDKFNR